MAVSNSSDNSEQFYHSSDITLGLIVTGWEMQRIHSFSSNTHFHLCFQLPAIIPCWQTLDPFRYDAKNPLKLHVKIYSQHIQVCTRRTVLLSIISASMNVTGFRFIGYRVTVIPIGWFVQLYPVTTLWRTVILSWSLSFVQLVSSVSNRICLPDLPTHSVPANW